MIKGAIISPCGKHRHTLERIWDLSLPLVLFIMLNPSTADAEHDDPTVRACIEFAKGWGYGGVIIENLSSYRSTDPEVLYQIRITELMYTHDLTYLGLSCFRVEKIVCAWGRHGGNINTSGITWFVRQFYSGRALYCFGLTKNNQPRHPLYIKRSTPLIRYM